MKIKLIFILGILPLLSLGQQINLGKDRCSQCGMVIQDRNFAAFAVLKTSETKKFDAIECLVNSLKEQPESEVKKMGVADYYDQTNDWVDATSAVYLKSSEIPSPMGAYLSAYSSEKAAKEIKSKKGGELFTWEELLERFKDSRFGLLDHPDHHSRPDSYAPVGVMGAHVHHQGGVMVGVSSMQMWMGENLRGTDRISDKAIYQDYMVAPQQMEMSMYMLMAMYAPTDKLTLMVMQPFLSRKMDNATEMGMNFQTESKGFGDTQISLLYSLLGNENLSLHLNTAVNIPHDNISKTSDTPMTMDMKLPYPMQIGSGTIDLSMGMTLRQAGGNISWGVQPIIVVRSGEKNTEGYRQGTSYLLSGWGSMNLASWMSMSIRLEGLSVSKIYGIDSDLNSMMSPAADSQNSGFTRVRNYIGANFSFSKNPLLKKMVLGVEYGMPIYQHAQGIQMTEKAMINTGIKYLM